MKMANRKTTITYAMHRYIVAIIATVATLLLASCASSPNLQATLRPENITEINPYIPVIEEGYKPYQIAFSSNYKRGKKLAEEIMPHLLKRGTSPELARFATAIVFPELTQYSEIRNSVAVSANRASIGTENKKNYSVGKLHMTPIFAEDVERLLFYYDDLPEKYSDIISVAGASPEQTELLRLERIEKLETQISYLLAFIEIFSRLRSDEIDKWIEEENNLSGGDAKNANSSKDASGNKTTNDNTAFYESTACLAYFATAYNAGFSRKIETLEKYMMRYGFPYGGLDSRSHWNYRTIAQTWFLDR